MTSSSSLAKITRRLVHAIDQSDDRNVEQAVRELSTRRRIYAPIGMVVGAFMMLFGGFRLLLTNWRLLLVQILPAMWIWLAMMNLKAHVFHGRGVHPLTGWVLALAIALVTLLTAAAFFLNAVFGFAIAAPGRPAIRPAFREAQHHAAAVLGPGAVLGLALGFAALYVDRLGPGWFAVSMSIVIGVMMVAYVTVPARLLGIEPEATRSDRLKASAVGGVIGTIVCTPPYLIARIGILLLAFRLLWPVGVVLLVVGLTLQIGATSTVKAIKMSARLVAGSRPGDEERHPGENDER